MHMSGRQSGKSIAQKAWLEACLAAGHRVYVVCSSGDYIIYRVGHFTVYENPRYRAR